MAQYGKYSEVSPQWLDFVAEYPELGDLDKVGIVERRRIFDTIEASIPPRQAPQYMKDAKLSVSTFTIPARDGFQIPVRSYIPEPGVNVAARPVLVYLHAGGFLFGDLESGDLNCRILATRLNISILNVGYRLAPDWPFPYGVNDSYDATAWVAEHAEKELCASPLSGFLVGGISSGANFAGVIAYKARDQRLYPPITGLFLSIPVCIMPQAYDELPLEQREQLLSLEQNAENPLLTRKSLLDIQTLYKSPPNDPRISFLLNKDHTALPKRAYFQICGRDPLRDEAFLWRDLLRSHSMTKSRVDLYSGMPHGFWRFLQMKASREWIDDLVEGIEYLIGDEDMQIGEEVIVKAA